MENITYKFILIAACAVIRSEPNERFFTVQSMADEQTVFLKANECDLCDPTWRIFWRQTGICSGWISIRFFYSYRPRGISADKEYRNFLCQNTTTLFRKKKNCIVAWQLSYTLSLFQKRKECKGKDTSKNILWLNAKIILTNIFAFLFYNLLIVDL